MADERTKPRSVQVPCDLPGEQYKNKWVCRKVRITIAEYETISRLTSKLAGVRLRSAELAGQEMTGEELGAEVEKIRKKIAKAEKNLLEIWSKIIVDWNLEDDFGEPLPDPYLNPAALGSDVLSMDEYAWLSSLIQDTIQEIRARSAQTAEGGNSVGS